MARITSETRVAHRRSLLEAAADEFAEQGLRGANINRISTRAGLGKGTVYNYFASKEALFTEVIREACARAAAGDDQVPEDASVREHLMALMAADIAWAREHEPFAKVLVREVLSGDPASHARVVEAASPYLERVASALERGVTRGEIRDDVPTAQLAMVFAGLGELALSQLWGSGGLWPTYDQIPEMMVGLFLEGAQR